MENLSNQGVQPAPLQQQIPVQNMQTNTHMGVSQKVFGQETFVTRPLNVIQARVLMFKMAKVLGGPFLKLFSLEIGEDDNDLDSLDFSAFSSILSSIDPAESVEIIKELCELTINQSKGRPTNYEMDFSPMETTDIEVALWVAQEQFGGFFTKLLGGELPAQALGVMGQTKDI